MNLFRSILSDEPDPPESESLRGSESSSSINPPQHRQDGTVGDDADQSAFSENLGNSNLETDSADDASAFGWSFGGIMKSLATRSESVLETYRRDLQEFGSGLKKETDLFREVASRAVKDLPVSIEAGASVAHGSLETVGHAIGGVLKSTTEIISRGKETLLHLSDNESDKPDPVRNQDLRRYNRFDAQLRVIQGDVNTYCEEPEDLEEYGIWKQGFVLEGKAEEVEKAIAESAEVENIYKRVVPSTVVRETFWCRYFYKVHKLKQQEKVRANLVKRAISVDEEELSWDVEDEDNEGSNGAGKENTAEDQELDSKGLPKNVEEGSYGEKLQNEAPNVVEDKEENEASIVAGSEGDGVETRCENVADEKAISQEPSELKSGESLPKSDGKGASKDKQVDHDEYGKDSDAVVNSIQHKSLPEEDELEWDEIGDIGSDDEKKVAQTQKGHSNEDDIRKRLSAAEEDEDLSWDIEDDDDEKPAKA